MCLCSAFVVKIMKSLNSISDDWLIAIYWSSLFFRIIKVMGEIQLKFFGREK